MQQLNNGLVLAKDDHDIIMGYLKKGIGRHAFNRQEAEGLEAELRNAKLVANDKMPEDVVRLNSTVVVKNEAANRVMELMVVTPEKADIKQRKISIMSPIGTALIGFRKGQKVSWSVPSGRTTFSILEVVNTSQ